MQTQVFAFALPLGRLIEGFLAPILCADGRFWLQVLSEDREVPELVEVSLDSERLGPILHIGALRECIPVAVIHVGNQPGQAERARIDAFYTGSTVIFGDRRSVQLHLRSELPTLASSLRRRTYTFADLLTYLGERSLADAIRAANSAEIEEVVTRFGPTPIKAAATEAPDVRPKTSQVVDLARWRQYTRELAAIPTYYSAPKPPNPRAKTSGRAHGTPRHA